VFNTSLGYSDFDSAAINHNYDYSHMDGRSTFISRAASMCASKSIVSSTSAGNQGNKEWYYITAPSDAFDILSVAAVDSLGVIASFSSRGPTYDGRLAPNVSARGRWTVLQHPSGVPGMGSGTSFSSPMMAGAASCLWQAYPEMPARDLIRLIRESGDRAMNPDATYGYGIPSFRMALWPTGVPGELSREDRLEVYPNPAREFVRVRMAGLEEGEADLRFLDLSGRLLHSTRAWLPGTVELPENLGRGVFIMEVRTPGQTYRTRILRQ
jgi:hypothetical protein